VNQQEVELTSVAREQNAKAFDWDLATAQPFEATFTTPGRENMIV
jgi:hypothetical protein